MFEDLQRRLAPLVRLEDDFPRPVRTLGGFDAAYRDDVGIGALVILDAASLEVLHVRTVAQKVDAQYEPGFLAARELPLLEAVWRAEGPRPDVLLVDGAGIMHPRRLGLASHAGVVLDAATIGIAKTPFVGTVGARTGDVAEVRAEEDGALLGYALWTAAKPIYVSPGHRVSHGTALEIVRGCCRSRIPEPIRGAHGAAGARRIV